MNGYTNPPMSLEARRIADLLREWREWRAARRRAGVATALALLTFTVSAAHAAPTKALQSITVRVMPAGVLNVNENWRITTADTNSCAVWVAEGKSAGDAYHACEESIADKRDEQMRAAEAAGVTLPYRLAQRTQSWSLTCTPRDLIEVALTPQRSALVTVWNANGDIVMQRTQSLDDPLLTLWDY